MGQYRYCLDLKPKKFTCPNCDKKRFVRYWDTKQKTYLPNQFGRCDREQNCGYSLSPYQEDSFKNEKDWKASFNHSTLSKECIDFIPKKIAQKTIKHFEQNNFIKFIDTQFGIDATNKIINTYFIGTSNHIFSKRDFSNYQSKKGANIFWQIDIKGRIRTGKIMLYDASTGQRIKQPFNHFHWAHYLLKRKGIIKKDFALSQCLFGEHQLRKKPNNNIGIVESEKTAIIMTILMPDLIWMATGGSGGINREKFQALKGKKIILFPDLGQYENWKRKIKDISNCQIEVSDLLEKKATENDKKAGFDLADYFLIKNPLPQRRN